MSNLSGHRDLRENPVSIEPGVFHTRPSSDAISNHFRHFNSDSLALAFPIPT